MKKKATQITPQNFRGLETLLRKAVREEVTPITNGFKQEIQKIDTRLDHKIEAVRADLKDFRDYTTQCFNKVDTRFEHVDSRLDHVEASLEHVADDVEKIKLVAVDLIPVAQRQQKNDIAINLLEQRIDKLETAHA